MSPTLACTPRGILFFSSPWKCDVFENAEWWLSEQERQVGVPVCYYTVILKIEQSVCYFWDVCSSSSLVLGHICFYISSVWDQLRSPFLLTPLVFICWTQSRSRTCTRERQILVFRKQQGTLVPHSSTVKRKGPNRAHLRVLWWNNSKCLSCIVWHTAGGALKPLLPAPKAPLNKIVKNNSSTLICPSDYCTQGGKLAADPHISLFAYRLSLAHIRLSRYRSILPHFLIFHTVDLHPSLLGRPDDLSMMGGILFGRIRRTMWLMGGWLFHGLVLIRGEGGA